MSTPEQRNIAYARGQSDLPGWCGDILPWQQWAQKYIPHGGTYVEIGTFLGASLAHMGTIRPDIQLVAIDPWLDGKSQGYDGPGEYAAYVEGRGGLWLAFLKTMIEHAPDVLKRTRIIRGTSKLVYMPKAADVVFIDGAHDRASVLDDLAEAQMWTKPGGLISGHDYSPDFQGVIDATTESFGSVSRGIPGTTESQACWWVET